jgi:preprotein translocase subunit SecB
MALQPGNSGQPPANPSENPAGPPQINCLTQYIKDLSFENPNAPKSLMQPQGQPGGPQISIQVNVSAKSLSPNEFEVELALEGRAGERPNIIFNFEVVYCGIFRFQNIPQEHMHPAIMIECPRLLFPFVRQIIGDAIRNGGFPPLYIDPIDFVALYQQKAAEMQASANKPTA